MTLFGRDRELAEARAALERALSGRASVLLLAGEPGIGKTRLSEAIANEAAVRGAGVHVGRGWEGGGAPAYWPWIEALGSLLEGLDDARLAALLGEDAPELVRLLPRLRLRMTHLEAASLPEASEGRFRLAQAIGATLRRAAAVQPRLIVLDDLHTFDASTLDCLVTIARSVKSAPLLLLGTFREAEARLSPMLTEKLGVLSREASTLHLVALESSAAVELARAGGLDGQQAGAVAAASGGNPLFLTEMSRLVASRGALGELPLGVKESIRQRVALLPQEASVVFEAAACAGRELDVALIAQALEQPQARVQQVLERALEAGMASRREGGALAFSHDLVREVIYRGLAPERRSQLHHRLAVGLRELGRTGAETASAIARHLLEAAELGRTEAIAAAVGAARRALELLAYEDALSLLDRAQAVAVDGAVERRVLGQLWCARGQALQTAGRLAEAKQACGKAAELALELDDVELLAEAALVWGAEIQPGVVDADLVRWLTTANAKLGDDRKALKARVLARLAGAMQPSPQPEEPLAMADQAIALARETADDRTLLEVLHGALAAMMDYRSPAERLPLNLEQEALARRFHDRPRELRALMRLVFDYQGEGDARLAEARAIAFDDLAAQLKPARFRWLLPGWRAMRALYEGRFADAERHLEESHAVADPGMLGPVRRWCQRSALLRIAERHSEGVTIHDEVGNLFTGEGELGGWIGLLSSASICWRSGQLDRARALLDQALRALAVFAHDDRDPTLHADGPTLAWGGEAFCLLPPKDLERAYQSVLRYQGLQTSTGGIGMTWDGPVDRMLGVFAGALGRIDTAISHYQAAIDDLVRRGGEGPLARTWLEAAELLVKRNGPGDAATAAGYVAEAEHLAQRLGQHALLALFKTRLPANAPAAPKTVPPSARRADPFSLRLEGEYWEIRGEASSFRLKDSRGLQLLARLVERPDQDVHCLELASDAPGADPSEAGDRGDAGEWLDDSARRQYQRRVEDLRETLAEAESFGDRARAQKARAELEFIASELSRGLGLGGKSRKAASATERARVAVQRRLKDAVTRISEHDEALGRHLEWAVKTGTYCCYRSK
ncbi:MAG: AAA family ATPase [Myxococcaceae bacterium]